MTKNIAIFGGAFNPIHIGHIEIAKTVLEKKIFEIDEIWFLVSFNPPHKILVDVTDFKHRVNMVKIAIRANDRFILNDIEYELYNNHIFTVNSSYNVLKYLHNIYKDYNFSLIIGYDELLDIEKWVDYKLLLNETEFIIIKRNDYLVDDKFINYLIDNYNFKYKIIDKNITNCSSTNIRNEIYNNNYSKYLDEKVLEYIIDNNLYK